MQNEPEPAYAHCLALARGHYENFPVASRFLPLQLRLPVAVIYAFARTGDDLADEGDLAPEERLAQLDAFGAGLDAALAGNPSGDPVLAAAAHLIRERGLPAALFHDLLRAFRMDVNRRRYVNFDEVLAYCRCSANPVGRLMLHLSHNATQENLSRSDQVCTALQLINFLQDLDQDYRELGRIYLPGDEMERFGVGERHFRERISDPAMREFVSFQVRRARELMLSGAPLGRSLRGLFGFEIRMIVAGGLRILDRLAAQSADVFTRPRLGALDRLGLVWAGLRHQSRI